MELQNISVNSVNTVFDLPDLPICGRESEFARRLEAPERESLYSSTVHPHWLTPSVMSSLVTMLSSDLISASDAPTRPARAPISGTNQFVAENTPGDGL